MTSVKKFINNNLKAKLISLIQFKGPISVSEYMKIVLTNPESGFYMNNDVFGVKGHFTTNPEISQIFGEVLGTWIFQEWTRFDCPKPLNIVEFGPGRGTLMADVLRTVTTLMQHKTIDHLENLKPHMIELSPYLKEIQSRTLSREASLLFERTKWFNHIDEMDKEQDGFSAFIAHEFLDALPIHKFVRDPRSKVWRELLIDYDQDLELRFCISKQPSLTTKLLIPSDFKGDHLEVCPEAALCLDKVATRLNKSGKGCMLICDYGFEKTQDVDESPPQKDITSYRDTFRAFKNHKSWPPLKEPGQADLTADVDFGYLKNQLQSKATIFGSVDQRSFLLRCGLQARLDTLIQRNKESRDELESGAEMLINDMGERYRFLALFPKVASTLFENDPPAGFES